MPHFTCPQTTMKRVNLSIFMSPFSFPSLSLCDSGGSDSLCQSQVSEDKGLQWLLLQAGSLSARGLESHSQSHITLVLIRLSPFPKNFPAHPEKAILLVITSCK